MSQNVAFILGGGPRIGHSVAINFLQRGFKVALCRRNPQDTSDTSSLSGVLQVSVDVSNAASVEKAFKDVRRELGIPNVIIYNTAALTVPPMNQDPFSVSPADFERDLAINVSGAYFALHYGTRGFSELDEATQKVFIATGNVTPFYPNPFATTLGSGKSALVQLIRLGVQEYSIKGYRFYFPSQTDRNNNPVPYNEVAADAHGEVYWGLFQRTVTTNNWDVRFVVGTDGKIVYGSSQEE